MYIAFIRKYQRFFVLIILFLISALATEYFWALHQLTIYADTMSRLDIARKIIDNITPGFAQLGNVWLPLPEVLMLPFIWSGFLWHSGLAGAFMSMTMYIIGGYYVYKAVRLLSGSIVTAYFSLSIYALNTNLLYLQSTAMSEAACMTTFVIAIYYFIRWVKTKSYLNLFPAGLAVSAMTLVRYEGLSILLASIPMVFLVAWLLNNSKKKAESQTIMYTFLAVTGFALWTLYLLVIFGDPLYWLHYYAAPQDLSVAGKHVQGYSQHKSLIAASWQYFTAMAWTIGIIPMLMAIAGSVMVIMQFIKKRTILFYPLFLPLSLFLFMVLTLQRNTPIVQPDLNLANIFSGKTSTMAGFNIRYGILLLPWIAIMASFVMSSKKLLPKVLVFSLFLIQIFSYIYPKFTVIYQIPLQIHGGRSITPFAYWLKTHYDGGKILVSALAHEDQMFEMGFDYKTYIHEGNQHYWKDSLVHPARYATWIVLDYGDGNSKDPVVKSIQHSPDLKKDYDLVYTENGLQLYKIKHKPYAEI